MRTRPHQVFVMPAKGNRCQHVTDACQRRGEFYLRSRGDLVARLAQDCIRHVEMLRARDPVLAPMVDRCWRPTR